jgi:hypothetical protein
MSGKGSGHCIIKIPASTDEPATGFAGKSGKPVTLMPDSPLLHWINHLMEALKNTRIEFNSLQRNADGGNLTEPKSIEKEK